MNREYSNLLNEPALQQEMEKELIEKVIKHRNKFYSIMKRRYMELIPLAISYRNSTPDIARVNFTQLEIGLFHGYNVVVGMCTDNIIRVMGYVNKTVGEDLSPTFFTRYNEVVKEEITFIINEKLIPKEMEQLTNVNKKGNFVVIRNKVINLTSDREIIEHYLQELSEIAGSRYSLIIQSKVLTFFIDEENSEDSNKIISRLYNGGGSIKVSPHFDPEEHIYTMNNSTLAQNLVELKSEYQNVMTELNNALGINSIAMEKKSGVSDAETKSNTAYTTLNANLKLKTRMDTFQLLNIRYGSEIAPFYDDEIISQLTISERGAR